MGGKDPFYNDSSCEFEFESERGVEKQPHYLTHFPWNKHRHDAHANNTCRFLIPYLYSPLSLSLSLSHFLSSLMSVLLEKKVKERKESSLGEEKLSTTTEWLRGTRGRNDNLQ